MFASRAARSLRDGGKALARAVTGNQTAPRHRSGCPRTVASMTEPERSEEPSKKSANAVGIGIALGLPLGAAIGMLVFDNLAMGAGLGMLLGIVIGAAYQAKRD